MRSVAAFALVLLAACGHEPSEGFPITPGGPGGTGSNFRPDAPSGDAGGDASTTINGRVCLVVTNAQTFATCQTTGAANLTVTLGAQVTTTASDGSFTIMRPASTNGLVWSVTGTQTSATIVPSAIPFGATTTLPAIDRSSYDDMVVSTQATIGAGTGALMARVTRAGVPVPDATATVPTADSGIFYDGPSPTDWQTDATGTFGVAWAPSVATGNATITVTSGSTSTPFTSIPVFMDTITFVLAEVP